MAEPWLPKEEYIALRKEVEGCMAELALTERACVLGVVAIFAWLASAEYRFGFGALVWITPFLVVAYGIWKSHAIYSHLKLLGGYLRLLELEAYPMDSAKIAEAPAKPTAKPSAEELQHGRWESYFERLGKGRRTRVTFIAWGVFALATILASGLGLWRDWGRCSGVMLIECPTPSPPAQPAPPR
ncbi:MULTISPECIES: hypothetical protein [unclassified Variovorax]|uniref:hypothetical protein n=1 Tax=unclassified Variovorax TaxID=663243 RepID=UPI000839902E|nr:MULTISPECIES: hypothetical protein [unclassified Variovorax]PNG50360.1 hypothetical protein CHC06_05983 [Variovorax sp. B2]PNG51233.1 hypothetical protein CHC07_05889 [Variovorax sp. B4]VTV17468.1 hypothetical protein WDL1P1_00410 [Variovorax sp. WDL1]